MISFDFYNYMLISFNDSNL